MFRPPVCRTALLLPVLLLFAVPSRAQQPAAQPPPGGVDLTKLPLTEALFPFLEGILVTQLNQRVAEADKWEVKLSRTGNDLKAGRIAQIEVRGQNIRLRDGLAIEEASLTIKNMKFDLKEQTILDVGDSLFTGKIQAEAVRKFALRHAGDKIKDLEIVFRNGEMEVWGEVDPGIGLAIPVKVRGEPVLHDNVIDFDAHRVSVASVKLPKSLVRMLEKQVNPVADLRGMKIPAKITKVAIEDARLVAEAKLDFSGGPPRLGKRPSRSNGEATQRAAEQPGAGTASGPGTGTGSGSAAGTASGSGTGTAVIPPAEPRRPGDRRRGKFRPGDGQPPPP